MPQRADHARLQAGDRTAEGTPGPIVDALPKRGSGGIGKGDEHPQFAQRMADGRFEVNRYFLPQGPGRLKRVHMVGRGDEECVETRLGGQHDAKVLIGPGRGARGARGNRPHRLPERTAVDIAQRDNPIARFGDRLPLAGALAARADHANVQDAPLPTGGLFSTLVPGLSPWAPAAA